ncbi:hypothetical protein NPIL_694661 [Nephila pilipes]|uniref:Uncharacterized protein n=1 Tax=Nephila pilipes TaxID=299642 RepID=A0A8X6PAE3_NEPPI|nr:hypothetical protein NPIL_694661 [Nephila pilipes]
MPSHVDIDGNKRADLLIKRSTKSHMEKDCYSIGVHSKIHKPENHVKLQHGLSNKSRDKSWENIAIDRKELKCICSSFLMFVRVPRCLWTEFLLSHM